jgi:Tfp pilus assembly protein PilW
MKRPGTAGGFSLVDLLVALLFLGFLGLLLERFSTSVLRGARLLEVTSESQQAARIGLTLMARDLRDAGYGLNSDTSAGIRRAEWDSVRIARDLSGDGDTDDSNELVGYSFDSAELQLQRQLGNAPPQPMLDGLSSDGLVFRFYNAAGAELTGGPLSLAQRQSIRRVDIELTLEAQHPDPGLSETIRTTRTTTVFVRNG